ncbi:glutathione-specific gamma-glutamylcyclotransferase 1-like [Uloborus diversus]|uniref:glutathione-specific gamma-glutamylcyclotransferase 1-like n=1 Tax=Uloborus diversus TaxID=327109 RepID=UPI002409BC4B|nr:glutathione-specific gamma-glutamylcyclotransferase 1-like [Uloborus diversus]
MWVFGYGSLIWNPGFEYLDSKVGYIKGYVRRFWQGNDFHRGNKEKPGRVATLVEDNQGVTWGRAFLLGPAAEASLNYLDSRENKIGGYTTTVVTFHPRDSKDEPFPVLLYVALPSSHLYLGPVPLPQLATEISEASGHCGHNAEYLLRLANFMKEQLPDVYDEHIYLLDHLVRSRLKEQNLSVEDVMGEDRQWAIAAIAGGLTKDMDREVERPVTPPRSPDFASRVPSRKLRCLDL